MSRSETVSVGLLPPYANGHRISAYAQVREQGEDAARCLHEELYFGYIGKSVLLGARAPD